MIIQYPSLILPFPYLTPYDTQSVTDTALHVSYEFRCRSLQEKTIHILAAEVLTAGAPGNLWVWVELSPYPSFNTPEYPIPYITSTAFWAAIGGGGGALPPVAPLVIAGVGVNGTVHTAPMSWTMHSDWARVVVQQQVAVATASWAVAVIVAEKTP